MAANSPGRAAGLRASCLSFPEVLAQAIGNIAPAAMPSVTIPLVFASAGNATWLTFVIATIGLVLVGFNINQFARRSAYPGSLYGSIARSLGSMSGILSGWSLILAYLFTAMTVLCGFVIYATVVLNDFGIQIPPVLLLALCASLVWYYAYTDIQLSTILMLVLETVSVSLILILALFILHGHGSLIDAAQLRLEGASQQGIQIGLVLAVFSYVGFESATVLGEEAKQPHRYIPWAIVWSTVLAGLFYILLSYVEVIGFSSSSVALDKTNVPLSLLAEQAGVELLGVAISVGITFSFFTCALASVNSGARIAFALARDGVFPTPLGQAHLQNETPHVAVTLSAILVFIVPASILLCGVPVLDSYSYLGTIATYGFLLVYILISIAAPIELRRTNRLKQIDLVISFLAVLFMLIPIVGSIYPVPAFPFNLFPYLFLLYLALGGWLFSVLRRRSPEIARNIDRNF